MPPRKKATPVQNDFLEALRFLSLVTKDIGPANETHIILQNNWAVAFNGTVAAGHPITEAINACPNNKLMVEALSKCGQHMSMSLLETNRISIKSDKFKALVPCVDRQIMFCPIPDPPIGPIENKIKEAFEFVLPVITDTGSTVYQLSVLMNGHSLISTDGKVVLEYWHGISLPTGLAIPKAFITPLIKSTKKLIQFGFSQSSLTVYFEDGSWIKTQLYAEKWPDIGPILNKPNSPLPLPVGLWDGLAAVAPFSDEGLVYFDAGVLRSHRDEGVGASYEVPALPKGPVFNIKQLLLLKDKAKAVDWFVNGGTIMYWFGDNVRGAIAGRK